jgi:hypothetical protein
MPARQMTEPRLAPELEAIAAATADRLRAQTDGNTQGEQELQRSVAQAARAAIAAGLPLGALADAERAGHTRARRELGADLLRRVERAARRKREADSEYEQAVVRRRQARTSPPRDRDGRASRARNRAGDHLPHRHALGRAHSRSRDRGHERLEARAPIDP